MNVPDIVRQGLFPTARWDGVIKVLPQGYTGTEMMESGWNRSPELQTDGLSAIFQLLFSFLNNYLWDFRRMSLSLCYPDHTIFSFFFKSLLALTFYDFRHVFCPTIFCSMCQASATIYWMNALMNHIFYHERYKQLNAKLYNCLPATQSTGWDTFMNSS